MFPINSGKFNMAVTLSAPAYIKIILHAAKYPHCSVNGVLLGDLRRKDGRSVVIVDAVPFFHQALTLAPMLEVALTQVDAYCKSSGLIIAGYYQANENLRDIKPNLVAYKVAERVHSYYSDACLIMVDNMKMSPECEESVCKIYQNVDGKWNLKDYRDSVDKETLAAAASLLNSRAFRDLVDFDQHLHDIQKDWKNLEVNELIQHTS